MDENEKRDWLRAQEWAKLPIYQRANEHGILNSIFVGPLVDGRRGYPRAAFDPECLKKYCPGALKEALEYSDRLRKGQKPITEDEERTRQYLQAITLALDTGKLSEEQIAVTRRVLSSVVVEEGASGDYYTKFVSLRCDIQAWIYHMLSDTLQHQEGVVKEARDQLQSILDRYPLESHDQDNG